ncbi:eukaryotic translation elongation factor 1 delta b (guanine nucleotide exchange protein) isoform X4 [Hemibagrus wyckioides]|uniref:eukaryotic translation elongation factor 1 delta b (guanine nucleotide exchange protein) isoform X4 n=1 Tax=Hemibagrus wyckioides TaxID=337641 RepID=UPI00266C8A6F|nr:eukaryotic translation elongation factor 1 delta b (guanine nucleotide exchange protein) isoform X4 [Hemibagrus wyckioides]
MPQRIAINSNVEAKPADVGGGLSSAVVQGLYSERAAIWFDCRAYERAESHYYMRLQEQQNGTTSAASTSNSQRSREKSQKRPESVPTPHSLPFLPESPSTHTLCDEGYLSQTPTPRTPASAPINGLPFVPAFLQGVWFQKPLYDRAEATFYQNLYRVTELQSTPNDKQVCAGHPRAPVADKAKSDKAKEKKPSNGGVQKGSSALCHFLHADSERVWLERSRYAEAETRFYEAVTTKTGCSLSQKMSAMECLAQERIWFDKSRYDEAERKFYESMNGPTLPPQDTGANSILQDIARARENIQKSLAGTAGGSSAEHGELLTRMKKLELENQSLQKMVEQLRSVVSNLESRVSVLEKRPAAPAAVVNGISSTAPPPPQKTAPAPADDEDDDDDMDLFGSDDEVDEEAERLKEQRLQEYAAKKAKKPAIIAKSSILLDVKPWDDETDMAKMEECVRSIQVDGLLWGASKLVPVGYGIKKLQINCVVEDDKVGTDLLEEEITKFEDYVQSVDVAAFNKI